MEKTTNNHLLPAGTGPERAPILKESEGPVPAGKKTSPGVPAGDRRDPEVPERPVRRRFLAEYKLQILRQADACTRVRPTGRVAASRRALLIALEYLASATRAGNPRCPDPEKAWSQAARQRSADRGEPSPGTREQAVGRAAAAS